MCGIIGVISKKEVYSNLYIGMLALQHRGQDACGMCVHDGEDMYVKRDVGLVSDVFTDSDAGRLSGKIGIGHVRYTTAGTNIAKNAQPFKVRMPVNIAMVSNGNTINTEELVD